MRLGFLLFDYFRFGGLQRDCLKMAALCAARGHDVTIFTRTWQGERPENVSVELFGLRGWTNVSRNRNWLKQLEKTLPGKKLEGVIGFNKLPGLDVYYGSDPCYVEKTKRLKPAWYRWLPRFQHFATLEKEVFQQGSKTQILLLTPHEISIYQKIYGTEPARFHLLPPGIARRFADEKVKAQTRDRMRGDFGWSDSERLLLFVGSGFRVKGLDRAIKALASLPETMRSQIRLVVIGQNPAREFAFQAKRAGIAERVHFLGGRDDVFDWMLASDLLLHPAYSESAGMILLEAMTAGLPVLTTDVCGYAFHIKNAKSGIVIPSPFNQEFLNSTLAEMLVSPERPMWRANGLATAATQDLYSCHEHATDIIEQTVRAKLNEPART
jgi:UDP-glucose:(heptosyl)LPS alpha-1,3-glucosyltransferase